MAILLRQESVKARGANFQSQNQVKRKVMKLNFNTGRIKI
jgi:hypothetical protein